MFLSIRGGRKKKQQTEAAAKKQKAKTNLNRNQSEKCSKSCVKSWTEGNKHVLTS